MLSKLLHMLRSALVCAVSLVATAALAQTAIHVGPGQTYTTIQSGIDAANAGDTVLVTPGTYNENINFNGKAITSFGGAASTIIDGGLVGPAVTFKTGETSASTISGFTIQHGGEFRSVPATFGQSVTFTAQLTTESGIPTGSIQFLDGATPLSTQTVSSTGSSSFSTSSLAVGSHNIIASYEPTGSFSASTASLTQVINGHATTTTLSCLPNPIDAYKASVFTATVTSANRLPLQRVLLTA